MTREDLFQELWFNSQMNVFLVDKLTSLYFNDNEIIAHIWYIMKYIMNIV